MLTIKIQDKNGYTKFVEHGENEVSLVATCEYQPGDLIIVEVAEPTFAWVQVDEAVGKSLCYLTENMYFDIPFDEKKICYAPNSFIGDRHLLWVKKAFDWEVKSYRNLAENVNDTHRDCGCFPHATANVETRGEAVFAARNAIDGVTANHSHGEWPYASWGINRQDDACLTLEFGRTVEVDKVVLYERADFPHDNYWTSATLTFSDGSTEVMTLVKTDQGQALEFEPKRINSLKLDTLIKSDEPSPFPALTQIQVFGRDL